MRGISLYSVVVIALTSTLSADVQADDEQKDLARLQGTWKLVEYETSFGKTAPERESLWVFSGAKLYKKSTVIENVYDIRIEPGSAPTSFEMRRRDSEKPRIGDPEFIIFKFVGEQLVIATSRSFGKRPEGFVPRSPSDETGVVDFVLTLKRVSEKAIIPPEKLKLFEDVPIPRTKNREAETALLKFMAALYEGAPLEVVEPLIAKGKAKQLLKLAPDRPAMAPAQIKDALKYITARDVVIGERVKRLNGESLRVEDHLLGPDKILLISQDRGVDRDAFWLFREDGQWKVDVTEMILLMQSKDLGLFGGILLGMKNQQVRELVEAFKASQQLKSYALIKNTDTELVVDWKEKEDIVRHFFTFTAGKLVGYTSEPLVR